MTFTYDVTTDIGLIRFHVGDVTEGSGVRANGTNFSDEELTVLLGKEDNDWRRVVAALCEILTTDWARVADITVGPRKENLSSVSKRYDALAQRLRRDYGGGSNSSTAFTAGFVRDDGYKEAAG